MAPRKVTWHFFIVIPIILVTSFLVWNVCVQELEHSRNFYRALNYHILEHDIINVYWFGQGMLNYPINEYYKLEDVQTFMKRMRYQIGNLDSFTYGEVNQAALNSSLHNLQVYYRNGTIESYQWTLSDGLPSGQPFSFDDLMQIKAVLSQCTVLFFNFKDVDLGGGHIWDLSFKIEPFSMTSIFVYAISHQKISLSSQHILPFILGVILGLLLLRQHYLKPERRMQNLIYYFLSVFLVLTSILSFSEEIPFETVFMFDGIACCAAWLCTIKFYLREEDYNMSFLLGQSYAMIGRLFASFGPLLIAFSLFAYVVFSRYSGQFSSFWRTFLSLFYICYYNMTYQSTMVTARANPISLIFFLVFVLVFTICIYSGMLVSIFCSYVWRKRQLQIRKDIEDNLRIQCSSCDHKYKYADSYKQKHKKSFILSEFLQIDWSSQDGREKYKRIMIDRIENLRKMADKLIDQNVEVARTIDVPIEVYHQLREDLWGKSRFLANLIGQE